MYCKKQRIPISLFDKSCTQYNVNVMFYMKKVDSQQVNYKLHYFSLKYFLKEIVLERFEGLFERSNCNTLWENQGMKEDVSKSFFR